MGGRWRLVEDNDAHWYVIPVERATNFAEWLNLDPNDEQAWDVPDYAVAVGGSYGAVTFAAPEIFGAPVPDGSVVNSELNQNQE